MKKHLPLLAVLLLAGNAAGPNAIGQNVYKCANVYSQLPCPGAVAVDASDSRSPAQKAQTDAAAAQSARSAEKMEKERLAVENAQALRPPGKPSRMRQAANGDAPDVTAKPSAKQKKKTPEFFTAAVPVEKKKNKNAGNNSGNQAQATNSDQPVKP